MGLCVKYCTLLEKCPFQSKRAAVEAMQKVAIGALIVKGIAPLAPVTLACLQLGLVAVFLKQNQICRYMEVTQYCKSGP